MVNTLKDGFYWAVWPKTNTLSILHVQGSDVRLHGEQTAYNIKELLLNKELVIIKQLEAPIFPEFESHAEKMAKLGIWTGVLNENYLRRVGGHTHFDFPFNCGGCGCGSYSAYCSGCGGFCGGCGGC